MTCGEIAVFVVTCITAVLFVVAIIISYLTVREAKATTGALREVQESISQESTEVRETTNQIRETKDAIRQQSEAIYISQLRFKWSSPEIRESESVARRYDFTDHNEVMRFLTMVIRHTEDVEKALEIPRFFENLLGPLIGLGCVRPAIALRHFGIEAHEFWTKFEPLIIELERRGEYDYGKFENFKILGTDDLENVARYLQKEQD